MTGSVRPDAGGLRTAPDPSFGALLVLERNVTVKQHNDCRLRHYSGRMGGRAVIALYVLGMVVVVVGSDIAFFRHHFWARLLANVGIILVFGAFYLRYQSALGGK